MTAIFKKYKSPIFWYIYKMVGSVEDAEDLMILTFEKIMVISVAAGHAVTGFGHRLWQWESPGDTLIIGGIY